MKKAMILLASLFLSAGTVHAQDLDADTPIDITLSWSQQPQGWTYPMEIRVPDEKPPAGGWPVCILLHGAGGNGSQMLNEFGAIIDCHALVGPTGYANTWNICQEPSDAPDVQMVSELVERLQAFDNVNPNLIRILGFSNGSALANRVLIENDNPGIDSIVGVVSQMTAEQLQQGTFFAPTATTDPMSPRCGYTQPASVLSGRRYLSICNENDFVIPFFGGPSNVGANFIPAFFAAWEVARTQGYNGAPQDGDGEPLGNDVYEYDYLDGDVVLLRGFAGHGMNPTQEAYLVDFLAVNCAPAECDGDLNGDALVNVDDLLEVISNWSAPWGVDDLLLVISRWGSCAP